MKIRRTGTFWTTIIDISEIQVSENILKCKHSGKKIPSDELLKYTGYINNIASTKISAMKNVAADAGSYEYFCYQYSEKNESYKGYLIKDGRGFHMRKSEFLFKKGCCLDERHK